MYVSINFYYRGKTHKNVVAQYLNKLAGEAIHNSERLLYELICMITKRNGVSYIVHHNYYKYLSQNYLNLHFVYR